MKDEIKQEVLTEIKSWFIIQVRNEASPVVKEINQEIDNLFTRYPK